MVEDLQLDVRQRAHRQRYALLPEPCYQFRILFTADAMIDALDPQDIERLVNVRRRPLLAGMRHGEQALAPCSLEHGGEFRRRVTALGRIEAYRSDGVLVGKIG